MFGYLILNKPEMKIKHFDEYQSYYCGLCRELKERFGIAGQITLTYDMTFVILLLDGLYEPVTKKGTSCCAIHPVKRQCIRKSEITEYAADMNLILSYYKCMDDWTDEQKFVRWGFAKLLEKKSGQVSEKYREKTEKIVSALNELSEMEKTGEKNLDRVAGCTGRLMEEILAYRKDFWEESVRRMGFYLGKFIYLLDAYDDLEEDMKNGNYNPFSEMAIMEEFDEYVQKILTMMMEEVCREFEKLPIIKHAEILRNILYSGVWCRFTDIKKKRTETKETK